MKTHVIAAIFKRNFFSYFSSPLGYVFICVFVLLSAFAAFWPNDFFNNNLANLDQLNRYLPWIMLVFIPAVTMGVWADERRQGTDELLLTLPATDFAVVIGKYLAAMAIFTGSLIFSLSNIIVLLGLGEPDIGLLIANYLGYWFTGAAMIAVGMAASFLTANLTVGFILGAAFNAPLVFLTSADAIVPWESAARSLKAFSIAAQFNDFGRGVISLSSVAYYTAIAVVMLYLCMIFVGRRHWSARNESTPMAAHYLVRSIAAILITAAVCVIFNRFDARIDVSSERLSSLSKNTRDLLKQVSSDHPVYIEAYISPDVPEAFVQTRLNLLAALKEVDAIAGDAVEVRINETTQYSTQAAEAQEQFGITVQSVPAVVGGKFTVQDIVLGVAFMCGLDQVVVPFFDRGIPIEYEIVRSITTVSQPQRMRVGVLATDAKMYGGFDMQTMSSRPNQAIINELQKQYEVVQVNPSQPISESYDVVLAVQPSSLTKPQLDNFLLMLRTGQPTVIFEDPFPYIDPSVPASSQPRIPPGGNNPFAQQQPPEPKAQPAELQSLWSMLNVNLQSNRIVWDDYNPYPKVTQFDREFVFVGHGSGAAESFNPNNKATTSLGQVLLLFPGAIQPGLNNSPKVTPLLRTGPESGYVAYQEMVRRTIFGPAGLNPARRHVPSRESYILAARITGDAPPSLVLSTSATQPDTTPDQINVTLVADVDVLYSVFFNLRQQGDRPESPVHFDFDNVTFVLNLIDELAGDDRYIAIRSRRPKHRTLTAVEQRTELARSNASTEREKFLDDFEAQRTAEEARLNEEVDALRQRTDIDAQQLAIEVSTKMQVGQNRLQARIDELQRKRDQEIARIERELALDVRNVQNRYKLAAIGLPPIPPLFIALIFFWRRRTQEQMGVPKSRLRDTEMAGANS